VRKSRIFAAAVLAVALAVLSYRIGPTEIAAQIANLRTVLPIVLLAGVIRLLLQTRAWWTALCAEGIHVPKSRLLGIRLASQAAGYLAALGPVVSEPAKLALLRNPAGMAAAAPATLVETGTYWFTTVVLGLVGACAGALLIADRQAVLAAVAVFSVALALLVSRRSFLPPLVRAVGPRAPGWLRSAELAERRIRSFRERHPQAARRVVALDSLAQLVTLAEVATVLWTVGLRVSILEVLVIEATGRMVKILGSLVPGRLGVDEGGAAASFALLGLSPAAGLMLAVARRVRDLLWCTAGIVWVARPGSHGPVAPGVSSQVSLCMEER